MSEEENFLIGEPSDNGVWFVGESELESILAVVRGPDVRLHLSRIDLAGCEDDEALFQRMASHLRFPAWFGYNWDALQDCLRDLSWLPEGGHALVFEHLVQFRDADEDGFDTLLDILDTVAEEAEVHDQPWQVFMVLPDAEFDQAEAEASA